MNRFAIFGYDPGGMEYRNGAAVLILCSKMRVQGMHLKATQSVNETLDFYRDTLKIYPDNIEVLGAGLDTCLSWATIAGGSRPMDIYLRSRYGVNVQSPNSLQGAMLTQGMSMAIKVCEAYGNATFILNESHPKVGYYAEFNKPYNYNLGMWWDLIGLISKYNRNIINSDYIESIPNAFFDQNQFKIIYDNDHVWDALFAAFTVVNYRFNPTKQRFNDLMIDTKTNSTYTDLVIPTDTKEYAHYYWI